MTLIGRQLRTISLYLPWDLPITSSFYVNNAKRILVTILLGPYASRLKLEGLSFPKMTMVGPGLCAFRYIPYAISDSIWLANGTLLVGVRHHMFLYGQTQSYGPNSTTESLFVHVARINGPLPDYHPQMLLQCLLWGVEPFFH